MKMSFARHETFHIREGWLTKALRLINDNQMPDLFRRKDALELLGIGNNMIRSLRHWMQATQLTKEPEKGKKNQALTSFGEVVLSHDRYIESDLTLWLIHYHVVVNRETATTWYWFFNIFDSLEFNEILFLDELANYVSEKTTQSTSVARNSLKRDFDCFIGTYVQTKPKQSNPEINLACPLQELRLIEIADSKNRLYRRVRKTKQDIPSSVLWFSLLKMKNDCQADTLKIQDILNGENGIGRVFNLNLSGVIEVLEFFKEKGSLDFDRTAGLNNVYIKETADPYDFLKTVYMAPERRGQKE